MFYITIYLLLLFLKSDVIAQKPSPCPRIFQYEPKGSENDRWYGTLTLQSDSELTGIWLRLILDGPSIQLGNWFGEVVSREKENRDYLIKNRNHVLKANEKLPIRFYVKYDPTGPVPSLDSFRLNAKTVCPEGGTTTAAPVTSGQLQTSAELATTESPPVGQIYTRPGGGWNVDANRPTDDDDFFQGDFAFATRPSIDLAKYTCGTIVIRPKPLITHGHSTKEGEYPWHIAIYHAKGIDLSYICGASLISKYHALTVAHCVMHRRSQTPLNPESLIVYLGKYYLKRWSNPGIQDKQIQGIIPHPHYNAQTYGNDIALLKMVAPVEITDWVRPVCLWQDSADLNSVLNKAGMVVGWGFDENGRVTEKLTGAQMPIVSQETCIYSFPDFFSRFTSSKTFCAGFRNGTSVCNGDSGGGMVFPKVTSDPNNPAWQLRGLVSISVALQNQFKCDAAHYVVFTDVAKYLDWIKASMNL